MAKAKKIAADPQDPAMSSLPFDQQEDIGDLRLPDDWYYGAALWSTDWTAQTIISQLSRGNINLSPKFQRRNAWTSDRKSLFIESLIFGLPIPQIILAEDKARRGGFIVIDGKQRLLALRQFAASADDAEFHQLRLSGLTDKEELNGRTYADFQDDRSLADYRNPMASDEGASSRGSLSIVRSVSDTVASKNAFSLSSQLSHLSMA